MTGNIRLVEPGSPLLPPRNPDQETWCDERIEVGALPMMVHSQHTTAYLCTRFPHGADEVHVSEPLPEPTTSRPDYVTIIWGGE